MSDTVLLWFLIFSAALLAVVIGIVVGLPIALALMDWRERRKRVHRGP